MANRPLEDKISLPAKNKWETLTSGVGRPLVAASGHCPSLVHCLVGPDVRWSVLGLGWLVWSGLWAFFPCVMQDAIVCDFVCIFVMFSSYFLLVFLQSKNHQNSWKRLEISPITNFGVWKLWKDAGVDSFISALRTVNNTPTLSLCSSSSKEAKTKVDATPLKKPAYKLFHVFLLDLWTF